MKKDYIKKITTSVLIVMILWTLVPVTAQTGELKVSLGVERINANTLQLTADSAGANNFSYRFDMRIMGNGEDYTVIRDFSSEPIFTWGGARDGELYEIVVHGVSEQGYIGCYCVFGNTDPSAINLLTGLNMEIHAEGNAVHVTAVPQGGTNVIYALQYRKVGDNNYNELNASNPYQVSPSFIKPLDNGDYEIVVHAIDMAGGLITYYGAYSPFTLPAEGSPGTDPHFWESRKSTWIHPLKNGWDMRHDPTIGGRQFGAPRGNSAHAGIDFIADPGTQIIAMTDGTVINIYNFYAGTQAVEVKNTDGTIIRYGEINPQISIGTAVKQGDLIGCVIPNNLDGLSMLHLEIYLGFDKNNQVVTGPLTQVSNSTEYWYVFIRNYLRRADLIDPTEAKDLTIKYSP